MKFLLFGAGLQGTAMAHDLLHMRQLVELLWAYTIEELKPQSVEYAGQW